MFGLKLVKMVCRFLGFDGSGGGMTRTLCAMLLRRSVISRKRFITLTILEARTLRVLLLISLRERIEKLPTASAMGSQFSMAPHTGGS